MMLENYLIFNLLLFSISFFGLFLSKQNIIVILMSIELMLLSINFNFMLMATYFDDMMGQLMFFFMLTLAGSEASVGLAMLMIFYSMRGILNVYFMNSLKG